VRDRHAPPGHARLALSDSPRGGHREQCRPARNAPRLGPGDRTRRAHAATSPPSRGSADGRHGAGPPRASRPREIRARRQAAGRPPRAVSPSANRAEARPRGQNAPHAGRNASAQARFGRREARCRPATRLPAVRDSRSATRLAADTASGVAQREPRRGSATRGAGVSALPRLGGREARCGPATRLPPTRDSRPATGRGAATASGVAQREPRRGSAPRTERAARSPHRVRPAEARRTGGTVRARHAPPGRTRLALSDKPRGSQHEPCRPARNAPRLGPRPASPPPREGRRAPEGTRRPLLTRRSPHAACAEAITRSRAPSRRRAAARS